MHPMDSKPPTAELTREKLLPATTSIATAVSAVNNKLIKHKFKQINLLMALYSSFIFVLIYKNYLRYVFSTPINVRIPDPKSQKAAGTGTAFTENASKLSTPMAICPLPSAA